ncbi:MAG: glycosyltransferase [Planctomycetota bacterium]|jgi:glycosyltransferase involved in cell wall biosynthesis
MRIGFDVSELNGVPGGVRTAIQLVLAAVHKYESGVELIALAPRETKVPQGIRMVATGGPSRPRYWRKSHALAEAAEKIDLFHSPVLAHPVFERTPVVVTVHELPFVVSHRLEGARAALVQWRWLTRAMGSCKAIVVPSRATLEQVRAVHPGAVRITEVIPHPAPYVDEMQHDHDGSLLFLGRLDRRKAVARLLTGAAQGEGTIRLVGPHDPERRAELETLVKKLGIDDRVEFAGEVDESTRNFLYRRAGVVALVSLSEGFGFPVLEALGRGVPVMVGRDTGAAEIGGKAVLAVDPDRPEEIAGAWRTALETEHRAFVRTQGPARLLEFGPERVAKAYKEMWRRALVD